MDLEGELEPIPSPPSSHCLVDSGPRFSMKRRDFGCFGGWGFRPQELVWWNHFTQRPHPHLNREARVDLLWFREGASVGLSQHLLYKPLFKNIPV